MQQNQLKILCAYVENEEPNWLAEDPEMTLQGHHVTIVHSFSEAVKAITDPTRGVPSFDIILADMGLPSGEPGENLPIYNPSLLLPEMENELIAGLGIFVPKGRETAHEQSDGYTVIVASEECWTPLDTRDWQALLDRVIKASEEADQFNVRYPESNTEDEPS